MANHDTTRTPTTCTRLPIEVSPERAVSWHDLALSDASLERLRVAGTHDSHTLEWLEVLALELSERLGTAPPSDALQGFIRDAFDHDDALDRLATIHTIEQLEGRRRRAGERLSLSPIPWPGWTDPAGPLKHKRLLRDLEFALVRLVALDRSCRHVATIALGECGAASGELHLVVTSMIDIRNNTVRLPGNVSKLTPRTTALPTWAVPTFHQTIEALGGAEMRILYTGQSSDLRTIRSCLNMNAGNILRTAGIGCDPTVSFSSLRNTAARKILDIAGTDAAVAFLGESNYERVRQKVGVG